MTGGPDGSPPLDAGTKIAVLGLLLVAVPGTGSGFLNGDAAVYAAQALSGDLGERTVHLGYLAPAWVMGLAVGRWLPGCLDLVSAASAVAATLAASRLARDRGMPGWPAAAFVALSVVSLSSFAEVDLPWFALLLWAACVRSRAVAGLLAGIAVTVSPVAALGGPWLLWARSHRGFREEGVAVSLGMGLAIGLVTLLGHGDYWTGPRGVIPSFDPDPLEALAQNAATNLPVLLLPWAIAGWFRGGLQGLHWTLPFLLAPTDVPACWIAVAPLALSATRFMAWRIERADTRAGPYVLAAFNLLLVAQIVLSLSLWAERVKEVSIERNEIEHLARVFGPRDAVLTSWSWGVRFSVARTGDPYGAPWRTWEAPRGRQAEAWCGRNPEAFYLLHEEPMFQDWGARGYDDAGNATVPVSHPLVRSLLQCPPN